MLDKNNQRLRTLLKEFQRSGSLRAFGDKNVCALTHELKPYLKKLILWVLGGHGGDGFPETQNANYILTYDNNDGSSTIHKIEQYGKLLLNYGEEGNFGTPFRWTYPSKRKGHDIQLKCRIIK